MLRPSVSGNETSSVNPSSEGKLRPWPGGSFEEELANLTARFASIGGSPDLASDLAFQVVLNEIVEQACLATGASGAAVALERDGELQCRASSGETAPELGTPVDANQGLSGECVRTRRVQVCADAATDLRVDAEASQQLGIRSVIVLPLLIDDKLVGVLEAFSARAGAFGERDQRTLETLAQRVLKSIELAASLAAAPPENREATADEIKEAAAPHAEAATEVSTEAGPQALPMNVPAEEISAVVAEITQSRWLRPLSWTLAALSVVIALGLWLRISQRMGWIRPDASAHAASPVPARNTSAAAVNSTATTGVPAESSPSPATLTGNDPRNDPRTKGTAAGSKAVPPGGLLVTENGREVFRMLPEGQLPPAQTGLQARAASPNANKLGRPDPMPESEIHSASAIEPDADIPAATGFARVPENVAEANLLYRIDPEYPYVARQQYIQGAVVLEIRAGMDGSVEHISLISGPPVLADAAITAVAHWRFKPELMKGQGKGIVTRITLNFRLPQ